MLSAGMFNSYRVIGINSGFILFFKYLYWNRILLTNYTAKTILQLWEAGVIRVQSISNYISSLILTEIPQQAAWSQECTSAGVRSTANKSQPENRPTNKPNHEKGILLTHNRAVLNFIRVLKTKTPFEKIEFEVIHILIEKTLHVSSKQNGAHC